MACYFPWSKEGDVFRRPIGCGQCIGCKLRRAKDLAVRAVHEASLYDVNSFILLTYKDAPFSLCHRDFQLFMKRLRKAYSDRCIRYFMCGEYGTPSARNGFRYLPHFHCILFNVWFEDSVYFKLSESGHKLYRSGILEKLWPEGHATVGRVTYDSCRYVAKYCTKKVTCPDTEDVYEHIDLDTGEVSRRLPEYGRMSLRPGLGAGWFERFGKSDVVPKGRVVVDGKSAVAPLYYRRKVKAMGLKSVRLQRLGAHEDSLEGAIVDNGNDRLMAKDAVARARLALFK